MTIPTLEQLEIERASVISYLKLRVEEEDWFCVADAAMDLIEIEAKMEMIKS